MFSESMLVWGRELEWFHMRKEAIGGNTLHYKARNRSLTNRAVVFDGLSKALIKKKSWRWIALINRESKYLQKNWVYKTEPIKTCLISRQVSMSESAWILRALGSLISPSSLYGSSFFFFSIRVRSLLQENHRLRMSTARSFYHSKRISRTDTTNFSSESFVKSSREPSRSKIQHCPQSLPSRIRKNSLKYYSLSTGLL